MKAANATSTSARGEEMPEAELTADGVVVADVVEAVLVREEEPVPVFD